MSSEVCPFCGKTYKRLKSHLPHCKAAASSKTPLTKHDVTVNQTTSSQLAAASSGPIAEFTQTLSTTASPQSKKSKKMSVASSAETQSSSPSCASLPPSAKKKKQKLPDQTKTAVMPSSTIFSLASSTSLPPSPTISKPKKKSLRALTEAAKSKPVSKASLGGIRSASEDLPPGSTPFVADPVNSTAIGENKTKPDKDSIKDGAKPTKMKTSKTKKKAAQALPTAKDTSISLGSNVNESSVRAHVTDNFWTDTEGEVEDLSVDKILLKSESGHKGRITLQDVKATLGRAHAARQSSRPSIRSQIETADDLSSKIRLSLSPVPLPTGNKDSCLVTTKTLSDQLPGISSQHTELQSVMRKSSNSKQSALVSLQQLELTSPAPPLLPGSLLSQVSKATSPPRSVSMKEGMNVTGLLTISPSLTKFSSPLMAARLETFRVDDGSKSRLEVRNQNTADNGTKGALTQRSLGQVRLRELSEWLFCKTPSRPKEVVEMVQGGWQWYYKKYIDVKKGGIGGLSMMLAGYCVLSYIWSYPRIKHDRWRKYH
ncbi:uncharacterized protein C17orf80 homolog isoform X2 [Cottoperca gobio]|uniref:Uncharacterized protein C17orf80 homolog isoform X2 n=1 Tax=Cottoperca gobio TaxID=56716 RepID=A0A6J2RN86_COTGO|nr:uncharacterized protein C17orf80 homolog isoform X2 [Cottoperca gobio]